MANCRLLAMLILFFLLSPALLWAESMLVPLAAGQTYAEVVRLWGPPDNKVIMESKRSDSWTYRSNVITFKEGKLTAVSNAALFITPLPKEAKVTLEPKAEAAKIKDQNTVDDILDEIIESSSESGLPTVNGPATALAPAEMPALPAFRQLERPAPGLNQPNPFEALRKRMLEAQQNKEAS